MAETPNLGLKVYDINDANTSVGEYIDGVAGLTGSNMHIVDSNFQDLKNKVSEVDNILESHGLKQKIYGVEIDEDNSNPYTRVTYTDDAIGMIPCTGNNGSFNYGTWGGTFLVQGARPCLLKNKTVNYYLDRNDYTKKLDGLPSDLTGEDGDVMVEFDTMYYKWTTYDNIQKIQISNKVFDGAVKYAHEVEQGYNQMPYYPLLLTQILFVILFKSTDSQTALGRGYVDGNDEYAVSGATNKKGFMFGEITGKLQNKFLGIEDYYGNKLYWIDGLVTDANWNLLIGNEGFNNAGSGYEQHESGIVVDAGRYVNKVQGGNEKGFILKTTSGSATTHYCDYGNLVSSRVAYFGGSRASGSAAGFADVRLVSAASDVGAYVGARLFCANSNKIYIGAYLGTTVSGKLRSISGSVISDSKTVGTFRNEAVANNI